MGPVAVLNAATRWNGSQWSTRRSRGCAAGLAVGLIEWAGGPMKSKFSLVMCFGRTAVPACVFAVLTSVASAQLESRVGTWELNVTKSTFSPGPPPQRQTLTFGAAGPQWTALLQVSMRQESRLISM